LVSAAHRFAYAGLTLLGLAVVGMTVIIFDAVVGMAPALVAGAITLLVFAAFWLVLPLSLRRGDENPPAP
jgi:hypothetical protein